MKTTWGGDRQEMGLILKEEILKNHYEWCKKNGRDTSWYGKYKRVSTRKKVKVRV